MPEPATYTSASGMSTDEGGMAYAPNSGSSVPQSPASSFEGQASLRSGPRGAPLGLVTPPSEGYGPVRALGYLNAETWISQANCAVCSGRCCQGAGVEVPGCQGCFSAVLCPHRLGRWPGQPAFGGSPGIGLWAWQPPLRELRPGAWLCEGHAV